jgi:hypothetical protein
MVGLNDGGGHYVLRVRNALITRAFTDVHLTTPGEAAPTFSSSNRYVYRLTGSARLQDQNGSMVHLVDDIARVSGALFGRINVATVNRRFLRTEDVTAPSDPAPEAHFAVGRPVYGGTLTAFLRNTETPFDDSVNPNATPAVLELPMGNGRVLSASAIVRSVGGSFARRRGNTRGEYTYQFTGPVATTTLPFGESSYTVSLDLDNGQTLSGTMLAISLQATMNYKRGRDVPFTFQGLMTGAVDFHGT